ncbi:hypothetical protein ACHAPT_012636 [Fusarium lateritium]
MPRLRKPENDLPLFICQCAILQVDDDSFLEWIASAKGKYEYRPIIATLRKSQTADQMALCLTALLCYGLVLDSADEDPEPIHGCYLSDFYHHLNDLNDLNGYGLENRRAMWEQMVCSFRRVSACHPTALRWLDTVIEAPPSRHWSDVLSDRYWTHRAEVTHESALKKTRGELNEVSKSLMACGWSLDEKPEEQWEIVERTGGTVAL